MKSPATPGSRSPGRAQRVTPGGPSPSGIVSLTTDFGLRDPFVGVMKGVILGRFPEAKIVDLTHDIRPQRVAEAAFWLERSYRWLPAGTVHVAVVDPGVGTLRPILAARVGGHLFLAPDNGLLGPVLEDAATTPRRVDLDGLRDFGIEGWSATFHGRDIFAPLAAMLASGRVELEALGPAVAPSVSSALPRAMASGRGVAGAIVTVDRFGNLITNVTRALIEATDSPVVHVREISVGLGRTYADVPSGEHLALINAFDVLEVACRDGSAAERLRLGPGDPVLVAPGAPAPGGEIH